MKTRFCSFPLFRIKPQGSHIWRVSPTHLERVPNLYLMFIQYCQLGWSRIRGFETYKHTILCILHTTSQQRASFAILCMFREGLVVVVMCNGTRLYMLFWKATTIKRYSIWYWKQLIVLSLFAQTRWSHLL